MSAVTMTRAGENATAGEALTEMLGFPLSAAPGHERERQQESDGFHGDLRERIAILADYNSRNMSRTVTSPSAVRLTLEPPSRIETELLVVPLFEGQSAADAIPDARRRHGSGELRRATESGELGAAPVSSSS